MSVKVLFIGLDSADKDLLDRWVADGSLPTIRSIMAESAWSEVANPPVFGSAITWISLFSGRNPGRHGHYYSSDYFRQVRTGTYRKERFRQAVPQGTWTGGFPPPDNRIEPFWKALSRAGRKVGVIDVPAAALSTGLNGIHVVDWTAHDRFFNPALSTPPELITEIEAKYGGDPVGACDGYRNRANEKRDLRDRLLDRIEQKTELVRDLLQRENWDLFMTVFHDAHCAGHQCWHIHDPHHVDHSQAMAKALGDPVKDVYVALDRAIAQILECADDGTNVILYAGPGMRPNYSGKHLLDEVLQRRTSGQLALQRRILARCKDAMKFPIRALPKRLRRPIMKYGKKLEQAQTVCDWVNRDCFQVLPHDDISGAIRLNIIGREPNGRIEPRQVDEYVARLTEDLLEITNVDTGEPFIKNVIRTSDVCWGERLDDLPDLFVEWNCGAPISQIWSPKIGFVKRKQVAIRTGDHAPHCFVFARGPGMRSGAVGRTVTHMDIAPTLSAMLGVDLSDVDGKPIEQMVGAELVPSGIP